METRQKKMEENLSKILETMTELKTTVSDLKHTVELSLDTSRQATQQAAENKAQIEALQIELDREKLHNAKLSSKLDATCERLVKLESQSRRDNLLFDGIEECDPNEDCTQTLRSILKAKLLISNADQVQIVRCHRLGPKRENPRRPRTIIVKFHWYGDRMAVWNQRKTLKGTQIYMNEDFPKEIQERRRILAPVAKKARGMGKTAFLNVDTLILDGTKYTVAEVSKLPTELCPAQIATPHVSEDAVAFFSSQSPLSNFFQSPFVLNGVTYDCVERYYQKAKAEFFNDQLAAISIMRADTARECYRQGRNLEQKRDVSSWRQQKATEVMYKGLTAKFSQSTYLKHFLLYTEDKTLIEANPNDRYWSCGLGLKNPLVASKEDWRGENVLGNLLMKVRGDLSN